MKTRSHRKTVTSVKLAESNQANLAMLKSPFTNHAFNSDEADVVAINDDRHASLNRFRRLTSNDGLSPEEQLNKHPQMMLAKLVEAKLVEESANGGYINEGMVLSDDIKPMSEVKLGIEEPQKPMAVDVRDVTFTYGFGKKSLLTLKKINVSVPQGKIYALLGSSGCGKHSIGALLDRRSLFNFIIRIETDFRLARGFVIDIWLTRLKNPS